MDTKRILEKIAFCYHEKYKTLGRIDDPVRDWHSAERALNHLLQSKNESDYWWRIHEEDYGEFRKFINEAE